MTIFDFDSFLNSGLGATAWLRPATSLIGAFVLGQTLAWVYERTYRGLSYSRAFGHSVILVGIAAAILVQAMQHSLLAGLGLFGVLSMIRFRSDLKTPRDLVFIMAAACIGVASGVAAWPVALLGAATFGVVALYLSLSPFGSRSRFDGVLRFNVYPNEAAEPELARLLNDFCRRAVLLSTSEIGADGLTERVYQIKFFPRVRHENLLSALRSDVDARQTRLLLQDSTSEY